jgi:hypothetical protein
VLPTFTASVAAARAAGDMRPDGIAPANAFWFAQHVAAQMAHGRVTDDSVVPYAGNIDEASLEAGRFCLRGMGLSEQAIARHFHPEALTRQLLGMAPDRTAPAVEPPPSAVRPQRREKIAGQRG